MAEGRFDDRWTIHEFALYRINFFALRQQFQKNISADLILCVFYGIIGAIGSQEEFIMNVKGFKVNFLGDSITFGVGVSDIPNCRYDNRIAKMLELSKVNNHHR